MAENVKIAILKISGPRGSPRKTFAEPRLPEKVLKPVERAGAAICTNSVAEIMRGVPPRGRDLQKPPGGMSERRQWVGHMRGVPSDTAAAFEKLERLSYYVSRAGPSRSRLKAPKRPIPSYARVVEGTINPRER